MPDRILSINNKKDEKFLREKTVDFDFSKFTGQEVRALIARMKKTMRLVRGIGLAANQIGLSYRVFVAEVSAERGGNNKFYALFNPKIEKSSKEKSVAEEGCLSVPGEGDVLKVFGRVERPERIVVGALNKNGKSLKLKVWGLLARVFQHEIDHLNGILFIDRTKDLYSLRAEERKARDR